LNKQCLFSLLSHIICHAEIMLAQVLQKISSINRAL